MSGFNFAEPDKNVARHIAISGTNTITLRGYVVGHDVNPIQKSIFLPSNKVSTVTLNKGLKLNIADAARVS
jgi:hypothetical protein